MEKWRGGKDNAYLADTLEGCLAMGLRVVMRVVKIWVTI